MVRANARMPSGSSMVASQMLSRSRISTALTAYRTKNPSTPMYTHRIERVSAASSAIRPQVNTTFGSTITPSAHRYGRNDTGPSRAGSIQGMNWATKMPSATTA